MPDLENGQTFEMQGSGKNPYRIRIADGSAPLALQGTGLPGNRLGSTFRHPFP